MNLRISSKLAINSLFVACNILLSVAIVSCGPRAIDIWQGKLYSYIGNDVSFERKQDNEIIPYDSELLKTTKKMVCMTETDFLSFLNTYVNGKPLSSPHGQ